MFKSLVSWFVVVFSKRVCTANQFISVCNNAISHAEKDADGKISVAELIVYVLASFRRSI